MPENTEKEVFLRYYSKCLTESDINSLEIEDIVTLLAPSSFPSLHESNRVIVFDNIKDTLIRYYNATEDSAGSSIVMMDSLFPPVSRTKNSLGRRYQYHGGNCGIFDGYFSDGDRYVSVSTNGSQTRMDSIPNWNIAHFFCDYFGTDEGVSELVRWVSRSTYWSERMLYGLANAFSAKA